MALWLLFTLFSVITGTVSAQQQTIKGQVSDEMGPIIGANVLVKGTTIGVITDLDGNFTITVPDKETSVLQISFIGYATEEIPVKGLSLIHI